MSGPDAETLHDKLWDCGADGCGECRVCRYLNHLEFASAGVFHKTVEADPDVEAYLDLKYPHWRK